MAKSAITIIDDAHESKKNKMLNDTTEAIAEEIVSSYEGILVRLNMLANTYGYELTRDCKRKVRAVYHLMMELEDEISSELENEKSWMR